MSHTFEPGSGLVDDVGREGEEDVGPAPDSIVDHSPSRLSQDQEDHDEDDQQDGVGQEVLRDAGVGGVKVDGTGLVVFVVEIALLPGVVAHFETFRFSFSAGFPIFHFVISWLESWRLIKFLEMFESD